MNFLDLTGHALGNLRRQRLRTILTCTGVAIGVWTTAIMMAFPAGVRNILANKLDRQELLTSMSVLGRKVPRVPTSMVEFRRLQQAQQNQRAVPLDDELVAELRAIEGVLTVYPDLSAPFTCELNEFADTGEFTEGLPREAITGTYREAVIAGSYWLPDATAAVCVFPSQLLPKYGIFDPKAAIGETVYISRFVDGQRYRWIPDLTVDFKPTEERPRRTIDTNSRPTKTYALKIVGVYDSDQFGVVGGRIHVPIDLARELLDFNDLKFGPWRKPKEGKYNQLTLKVVDRHQVKAVREQLDNRGLGTIMTTDLLSVLNVIFAAIEAGLGLFGAVALFVAMFGIANTMVMAVLERTREIGILKALGGRDRDVWLSFVTEAGGIGFLGGVAGVVGGLAACKILNAIGTYYLTEPGARSLEVFQISPLLGAGLVGFATFVATIAGVYPAFRASKLDPVEALRRE